MDVNLQGVVAGASAGIKASSAKSSTECVEFIGNSGAAVDASDCGVLVPVRFNPPEAVEHFDPKGFELAPSAMSPIGTASCFCLPYKVVVFLEQYCPSPKHFVKVLSNADTLGAPVPADDMPVQFEHL